MGKRLLSLLALTISMPVAASSEKIRFNQHIRPILSEHCFSCHGPDSGGRKAGLRLDDRAEAIKAGVLTPGRPQDSELVRRIFSEDPHEVMPPPKLKKTLSPSQKEQVRRWVAEGAEYERHWAFQPIAKSIPIPQPRDDQSWIRNPIDAFVLDQLKRAKLEPAEPASRAAWLRRVTFDLTGLPPSLEELDAFLADSSEHAYENVVTRLFRSPAYGERMANEWLDAARYADTFGYQADRLMHVWPWRDWVIRAFQSNLSYDRFILWQIAGDMLPAASREQKLATAFNRLHRQTNEGGSVEEEFRIEYVADRVRTMGTAFLGLNLECARCHDHKFDPIRTKEYYELSAFFNNIDERGIYSHGTETAPTPNLFLYQSDEQEAKHLDLKRRIEATTRELHAYSPTTANDEPKADRPTPIKIFSFEDVEEKGDYRSVPGKRGKALELGGDDAYLGGKETGVFSRTDSFSMALWLKASVHRPRMVVLHRSQTGDRGYWLLLDNGRLVLTLSHFWPGNALQIRARDPLPLGEWTHVAFTYDGSSQAKGLRLYVNGSAIAAQTVRDHLTRDILHREDWGDMDAKIVEFGVGARQNDVGFHRGCIDEVELYDRDLSPLEVAAAGGFALPDSPAARREHVQRGEQGYQKIRQELRNLCVEENKLTSEVPQIMVMQELRTRRPTFVLNRGAYDAPGPPVTPNTPAGILPFPTQYPRDRLGFAKWLLDDRNPLTARVAVNRFWQMFFGSGLVATADDFGTQGALPSHPELLDWLARDFIDSGWDVQRLCRSIVLSSTYRQSTLTHDPKLPARDPENRLLARGPRTRLSAEMLRDQALALSGLLVRDIGGPSVFPYQPAGLWEETGTNHTYTPSKGAGLHRRSMYTFWRRTMPPPNMTTFDAPSREFCITRRERTGTPLQALVLLNDTQFVEAARVLAEGLFDEPTLRTRLAKAFRMATSRSATDAELQILERAFEEQHARFSRHRRSAEAFLRVGEAPRNSKLPPEEHASLAVVVQMLLNLDECVKK